MKKLVLITTMLLCACSIGCADPAVKDFHKVEFDGHTYVVYDGGDYDSGVVHDPNCRCRVKTTAGNNR